MLFSEGSKGDCSSFASSGFWWLLAYHDCGPISASGPTASYSACQITLRLTHITLLTMLVIGFRIHLDNFAETPPLKMLNLIISFAM